VVRQEVVEQAPIGSRTPAERFADGVTEEIITVLSQVRGLRVAARNSSFAFKGAASDLAAVATRLNVGTLLTGSVRAAGGRLRIAVQLVDAANGFQLWSERFDRPQDDVSQRTRCWRRSCPSSAFNGIAPAMRSSAGPSAPRSERWRLMPRCPMPPQPRVFIGIVAAPAPGLGAADLDHTNHSRQGRALDA
jgi:hypothetical protein